MEIKMLSIGHVVQFPLYLLVRPTWATSMVGSWWRRLLFQLPTLAAVDDDQDDNKSLSVVRSIYVNRYHELHSLSCCSWNTKRILIAPLKAASGQSVLSLTRPQQSRMSPEARLDSAICWRSAYTRKTLKMAHTV